MLSKCVSVGFASLFGVLFLCGCGGVSDRPEVAPVSGVVKYKDAPVEGAHVTFISEGSLRVAMGVTDSEGRFKLTTFATDDGAVIGNHAVTIHKPGESKEEIPAPTNSGEPDLKADAKMAEMMRAGAEGSTEISSELPIKYAKADESGLVRSVAAGANDFEFDLTD